MYIAVTKRVVVRLDILTVRIIFIVYLYTLLRLPTFTSHSGPFCLTKYHSIQLDYVIFSSFVQFAVFMNDIRLQ